MVVRVATCSAKELVTHVRTVNEVPATMTVSGFVSDHFDTVWGLGPVYPVLGLVPASTAASPSAHMFALLFMGRALIAQGSSRLYRWTALPPMRFTTRVRSNWARPNAFLGSQDDLNETRCQRQLSVCPLVVTGQRMRVAVFISLNTMEHVGHYRGSFIRFIAGW